ncbi:MAG: MerR family transcriptional regulator [Acidisphaera sp.]|nr:MerR family transcriptional regulator [Acidisphaera sp.]
MSVDPEADPTAADPARVKPRKAPNAFRTISEVADDLHIPQHVLRFWETKFPQVRPLKRGGGRRYYRPDDIALLRRISDLLYIQGYTIKGVQRLLREGGGTLSDDIPPPAPEEQAHAEALDSSDPQLPMPGLSTSSLPPAKLVAKAVPRLPGASNPTPETASGPEHDELRAVLSRVLAELEALRELLLA